MIGVCIRCGYIGKLYAKDLCKRCYNKRDYQRHKQRYVEQARAYREKHYTRKYGVVNKYKQLKRCDICRENHPACLEFHAPDGHRNDNVGRLMGRNRDWNAIKDEIRACRVLCCNCHRKLHYEARLNEQV